LLLNATALTVQRNNWGAAMKAPARAISRATSFRLFASFVLFFAALVFSSQPLHAGFTQQGTALIGTGAVGQSFQGKAVALSADGNTAIVGGYIDDNFIGAVWVFTRSNGVWNQQGDKLIANDSVGFDIYQGRSVALSADGNTAIVGGTGDNGGIGAAWIYTRSNGVWTQQGNKLLPTTRSERPSRALPWASPLTATQPS
jgi:hypothetical protein